MSVEIIPVIDLLDGHVVHGHGGRRERYEPIRSPLCDGADPERIARALLGLGTFRTLYVADLAALLGRGNHHTVVQGLRGLFPRVEFWVDAGKITPIPTGDGSRTVIGTETGIPAADLLQLVRNRSSFVLSLDFTRSGFAGDPDVLRNPGCWPRDVILMHLPGVGGGRGPDWSAIDPVIALAPDRNWYVGGGVRDQRDLDAADTRGVRGVLSATALHQGTLRPAR